MNHILFPDYIHVSMVQNQYQGNLLTPYNDHNYENNLCLYCFSNVFIFQRTHYKYCEDLHNLVGDLTDLQTIHRWGIGILK